MNILLSLTLLLMPIKAESGRYTIFQDGQRIGTEEFTITPKVGGYSSEGRTHISSGSQQFDLKSRMELNEQLKPLSYEFEAEGIVIRLKVADPVSELEFSADGKTDSKDVRFPANGAIIDANFFHHYQLLLYRMAINGQTVDVFIPREMTVGKIHVRDVGNRTYELETADGKAVATTDAEGHMIKLTFPDSKVVVER